MAEVVLDRGDVRLSGTAVGAGPTVLLLHAGGEERGVWAPIAAALDRRGLRTVAFDLRGHGESEGAAKTLEEIAEDVTAMIRQEKAAMVVGASLGGLAAVRALSENKVEGVAGLVLVDVLPHLDPEHARGWLDEQGLLEENPELIADIFEHREELQNSKLQLPILLVRAGPASPVRDADVDRFRADHPTLMVAQVKEASHLIARDTPAQLARIIGDWTETQT
ncbi:alpha/beta hydrolase [Kribbella sp. NBC_01505]